KKNLRAWKNFFQRLKIFFQRLKKVFQGMKKNFQGKAIILKILQGRWCALAYPESPIPKAPRTRAGRPYVLLVTPSK
ncbi:MAG: hypothetical protein MR516_09190, partial [Bacteroidales bacterium]|nr:hypothetical protein [Bacteroidales bacterium]